MGIVGALSTGKQTLPVKVVLVFLAAPSLYKACPAPALLQVRDARRQVSGRVNL